jgi:glycosyltransferase involved in cell wall biosynthesis
MELTILMPCLNEERTLPRCIQEAKAFLEAHQIPGEVLIADNGSSDRSVSIAQALGARVVCVTEKGYGAALSTGIKAAHGRFVIFGDSDESYDFSSLAAFVAKLRAGHDLVVGNRFQGGIEPGAMPFLHRYLGNPVLSYLGRILFNAPIGDFHCGLRGFDRHAILGLGLKTTGMEFASEIIIRAVLSGLKVSEVPTTLRRDGRDRAPHLRTWRDGWRHLIYMLLHSPKAVFIAPGFFLAVLGLIASTMLLLGPQMISGLVFDIHTLLFSGAATVGGMQLVFMGVIMQIAGEKLTLWPVSKLGRYFKQAFRLELGLIIGAMLLIAGLFMSSSALSYWGEHRYAAINPEVTMRLVVPAVMAGLAGLQTIMFSMVMGFMNLTEKR